MSWYSSMSTKPRGLHSPSTAATASTPLKAGSIRYGGVDVRDIGWSSVREHVGVVLQHPVLFNASLRDNLCLGREYGDDELWNALEIAQLSDFVAELPDGLGSQVGKSGVRLSGGQRQRMAIARMVLARPEVVILDEATSALDSESERAVQTALDALMHGRTTLIIAHRLSTIEHADRIVVLDAGRVAEQGTHAALLATGGLYARLHAMQFRT